jgi:Trehalose utilisation
MGPLVEFRRRFVAPLVVLFALLALAAPAAAAPTLSGDDPPALGSRDFQPTWDDNVAGMAEAFSFKATADGPVDIVNVYLERHWDRRKVGNPGARLIAGIYADANGQPGALLGQGSLTTFRYAGWNTVPIAATELEKGKTYYIAMLGLRDDFVYRTNGTGTGTSPSFTSPKGQSGLQSPFKSDDRRFPKDSPISAYAAERYSVLVFTKGSTGNTTQGVAALRALARAGEVTFDVTDDASKFTESNLAKYRVVVFLNNAGELLDGAQQGAFEDYFKGGGGFLGIHSAIEAEPDWQFMSDLLGTRASGRTDPLSATTKVADRVHIASKGLPEYWTRTDRWYNFTSNVRGFSHVLATVDENTYNPGEAFDSDHPIAWCKD